MVLPERSFRVKIQYPSATYPAIHQRYLALPHLDHFTENRLTAPYQL
jgi:hypothetical protein